MAVSNTVYVLQNRSRHPEQPPETSTAGYKWGAFGEAKCNWLHKGRREAAGISASPETAWRGQYFSLPLPPPPLVLVILLFLRRSSCPTLWTDSLFTFHPLPLPLFCVSRVEHVPKATTKSVNSVVFHDRATPSLPLLAVRITTVSPSRVERSATQGSRLLDAHLVSRDKTKQTLGGLVQVEAWMMKD